MLGAYLSWPGDPDLRYPILENQMEKDTANDVETEALRVQGPKYY